MTPIAGKAVVATGVFAIVCTGGYSIHNSNKKAAKSQTKEQSPKESAGTQSPSGETASPSVDTPTSQPSQQEPSPITLENEKTSYSGKIGESFASLLMSKQTTLTNHYEKRKLMK